MIKDILQKHDFRFNKKYGQNFISDKNLLNAIISDAEITQADTVVEIGAGAGTLTLLLSLKCGKLISFEIDLNLKPVLDEVLADRKNVEMIYRDVLKTPVKEIDDKAGGAYKVVANLPYYITTPIIMNFVEKSEKVESMTLMMQKEVAERLTAASGGKDYGAVTVAVQSAADVKIVRNVKREMFFPVPNVDSAVVRIDINKKKYNIRDRAIFEKTVRAAFGSRRKQLQNNLSAAFGFDKEKTAELIDRLGVGRTVRGEALSVEQFVALADLIQSEI